MAPSPSLPPATAVETWLQHTLTMRQIDAKYEHLGCLGHGGFGSVFLARKRTAPRRLVAIKVVALGNDGDVQESFARELDAVVSLNTLDDEGTDEGKEQRDIAIIYFREWFACLSDDSKTFSSAFIVMNFVEGGTLAEAIDARRRPEDGDDETSPFAERRIAWYLLQLCDALSFAHERGVSHHDIKSENVLVDARGGGRLVLTDFGTAVRPGQERIGFTYAYASAELLAAQRSGATAEGFAHIHPPGVDAFGLGCIAFELLVCRRLRDVPALQGTTLADLVTVAGRLESTFQQMSNQSLYSNLLREQIIKRLLDPNPATRAMPSHFPSSFREDPQSPLLSPMLPAAYPIVQGGHLTMDNIQLGCFVQRGPDWDDGDADGGEGSIGVVIRLDPDALYTEVAWPNACEETYRIGANCKMELSVGPTPLPNGMQNGFLTSQDVSKYFAGNVFCSSEQQHPANGMVIASVIQSGIFVVPPPTFRYPNGYRDMQRIALPPETPILRTVRPRDAELPPERWDLSLGELCDVHDDEKRDVLALFHAPAGGLSANKYSVLSIKRVQSVRLWEAYARRREVVALENWDTPNERRLFHGTSSTSPETIMHDRVGFDPRYCDQGKFGRGSYFAANSEYSHRFCHQKGENKFQIFLARVTLGRSDEQVHETRAVRRPSPGCHSVVGLSCLQDSVTSYVHVIYETSTQAYPEYLITYSKARTLLSSNRGQTRRVVKAKTPIAIKAK